MECCVRIDLKCAELREIGRISNLVQEYKTLRCLSKRGGMKIESFGSGRRGRVTSTCRMLGYGSPSRFWNRILRVPVCKGDENGMYGSDDIFVDRREEREREEEKRQRR